MGESGLPSIEKQFKSSEEELSFLCAQVAEKERELRERGEMPLRERVIEQKIEEYKTVQPEKILTPEYSMTKQEAGAIVLDLSPETHDLKMAELLSILQEKGVKNALFIVEHLNNPHIEDDFQRFLVQYIKAGLPLTGIKEKDPLSRALHMTLYEIALPEANEDDQPKPLKEIVSSMEQFYSGMLSVNDHDEKSAHYFTLELAVSNHSDEFIFYAGIPDSKKNLFEKQILSIFHDAKVTECKNDYNIFNENGVVAGSVAELANKHIFPLKTYDEFDHDPLNVLLNSFSKIKRDGQGGVVQMVFRPVGEEYTKKYKYALDEIQKGVKVKYAVDIPDTFFGHMVRAIKGKDMPKKSANGELPKIDEVVVENIKKKISSTVMETNIRLIASAQTEPEATQILSEIESAFNQFENTNGNRFKFERLKKKKLNEMIRNFSFRLFDPEYKLPLNIHELTSVMHLPSTIIRSAPQLKISKAGTAPAPLDMSQEGILLGVNSHRNLDTQVHMLPEDRLRHFYVIGQTGTGKTNLIKNMIVQDIQNGEGVCMIDPHGSDIQDVLSKVPANRYEDVIYFDPAYTERPMALNMLEYDRRFPEQKTFVVNELFSIFQKLYGAVPESMGPMFEQYFRNATMLVIEDPDTGSTLLDVSRVMSNKAFRDLKISHCKNPVVVQFWKEVAEKAGGEASLANIVPYITSKFDVFLANEIMRPIIAQEKSSFNFRQIMDEKKILLVNLSKGRLGDINANLIGLILVGKILMAALSRVDSLQSNLPPFYLYIDEFQNITTSSISTILSEARKYKLGLNIAHQFIAQLEEGIKDSVFGNVGSIAAFRVGAEDAEYLEKQFSPVFTAKDIMNIDNYNAYMKMLVKGKPVKPFSMRVMPPTKGNQEDLENLKTLSYLKFGRDHAEVNAEVMKKYQK